MKFLSLKNGRVISVAVAYGQATVQAADGAVLHTVDVGSNIQAGWSYTESSLGGYLFSPPGSEATSEQALASAKEEAWEGIKAYQENIRAGGVKVGTKWYHTDEKSRLQWLGLARKVDKARAEGGVDATRLQMLGQDLHWKTMDGSFIFLTIKHVDDVFDATATLDAMAFAVAEQHRASMLASSAPAQYDHTTG